MPRKLFDTLVDNLHDVMVETLPTMVDKYIKEQVMKQVPKQVQNQVLVYVAEGLILERQKAKELTKRLIAKAILQEHGNIQAQISRQIENAIANVIPSQVDASVRTDPQLQQQDIAIWLALHMKFERNTILQTVCRTPAVRPRDQDDPHDDAHPEGENSAKRQKTSEYEAYVSGESSSGQVFQEEQAPSTSGNQEQDDDFDFWTDSYASDDDEIPTKQVSQDIMEEVSLTIDEAKLRKMADEMLRQRCTSGDEHQYHIDQMKNFLKSDIVWESRKEILVSPHPRKTTPLVHSCQKDPEAPALSLINQDLLYLKKGNSGPEKIVLSLHKFPAVIFNDDDIEERTSRWVNKCVRKFNPYARYGVEHWKNPHAKIFYIRKQKEPGKPKEEVYSNSKIIQVVKTYWELGHEHKFITEIVARRANKYLVSITEPDYKNLNKNDIEDIYLLIMNGKVPDYADTGLLWSLSVFIRSIVIWERVHDFQLGIESYQQKVNLTAPTMTFPGIKDHEMFSIIYEPVHGIIYKNSKKEKWVMRHLEIYKFCDATLNRVLEGLKSYNNDIKYGLVAQGHTQEEGIDYDEVFAPVVRIKAIRLFLAYASFKDFVVYQMDVKSAFLYGKIEEEVFMSITLVLKRSTFLDKVYKVEKALYGLHQAPRAWYETFLTYMLDNGFHRGQIDKTLFNKRHKDDILLVQVYDDNIIFGPIEKEVSELLNLEKVIMIVPNEFYGRTFFLFGSFQVQQKSDGIFISQDKYVAEILKKFDLCLRKGGGGGGNPASTPIETNRALIKDEEAEDVDVHLYRSMIGSLMYLTASRPNIMFVVCACARFQVTPKTSHLNAVKRIFRYLKGQPKLGLWYPRDSPFDLEAFSDSDYAGASPARKSTNEETASASTSENEEIEITATIDGIVKTITEASIRRHLKLEDSDGIPTLPNAKNFEQLALMGPKKTAWDQFSSNIATAIIFLATNRTFNFSKMIFEEPATMPYDLSQPRVQSLGSDEGSLTLNELTVLCTTLSKKVGDLQNDLKQTKLTYGSAYTKLILRVKKFEHKVKISKFRRRARVIIFGNEEDLEDSYKQGRIIAEIDQNPSISLVQDEGTSWIQKDAETQGRTSADTKILLEQEESTELVEDPGSGEKGKKEISTVKVLVSTTSIIPEVSTAIPERQVYIRRSAEKRKDKGKAIMKDDESVQKKTKKQLEQERLRLGEAIRRQEQINEEERQRIARDAEIAKQLLEEIDIARQE
ncbi:retrovirus-related pol polyprotein from transposon TNT 1-94 [Tanacetum coccineum]